MLALDKKTGKKEWQSKDITDKAHYSSCITFEHGGKTQIAQLTADHVFGLDAENGDLLWQHEWDGKTAVIPTPIYKDGHVYVAQPPLFRVKSKKNVRYVQTEEEMKTQLLDRGLEGAAFDAGDDRLIEGDDMERLCNVLASMEEALIDTLRDGLART